MKIFELLNQNTNQAVDPEAQDQQNKWKNGATPGGTGDDTQGKFDADDVDQGLQDLATQTQDQNAQPEPPGGSAQQIEPELDNDNVQPIDDALLQQIKNQPYVTKYNVKDSSPISPLKIASMQLPDLANLKNMVRFKIQATMMQNRVGLDDDPTMEYCSDLLRYINTVSAFKTTNTKTQLAQINPTPYYQQQVNINKQ